MRQFVNKSIQNSFLTDEFSEESKPSEVGQPLQKRISALLDAVKDFKNEKPMKVNIFLKHWETVLEKKYENDIADMAMGIQAPDVYFHAGLLQDIIRPFQLGL